MHTLHKGLPEHDAIGQIYSPAKCRCVLPIIDEQLLQVVSVMSSAVSG